MFGPLYQICTIFTPRQFTAVVSSSWNGIFQPHIYSTYKIRRMDTCLSASMFFLSSPFEPVRNSAHPSRMETLQLPKVFGQYALQLQKGIHAVLNLNLLIIHHLMKIFLFV